MGKPRDFYEVLNIPKDSSPQEIRRAYKTLVMKWHPDKHPLSSKHEAETMFKSITEAYEQALNEIQTKPNSIDGDFFTRGGGSNQKVWKESKDVHGVGSSPKPGLSSKFSTSWRKPPPLERNLDCTLEELFSGCKKEICFVRDVVVNGSIVRKEETQKIKVKPGWRKGTKITFEGMGDERPGCIPADIIYVIAEKEHPFYKRVGDDLVMKIEIPLVSALAGWTFSFNLITGEKKTLAFQDEVIYPGYEKVIEGQGMPVAGDKRVRGDLKIKFLIRFPKALTSKQRNAIQEALKDD